MQIGTDLIKKLREQTGVGIAKCKEALVQACGDVEKAVEALRKLGIASAVKKEGRETHEGAIASAASKEALILVELNAESDFVVQNDRFQSFLCQLAQQIAEDLPHTLQDLLNSSFRGDRSQTVDQFRAGLMQSLGENLQIRRYEAFAKGQSHSLGIYIHSGNKLAAVVQINGSDRQDELARDIAMHIVASNPEYLSPQAVPLEIIEKEREIARSLMKGKPPHILEGIVEGKIKAHFQNICLTEQEYIKDQTLRIKDLLAKQSALSGNALELANFARWAISS